jgi:diguanylate cyclase (GGDEF)-like protein
MMVFIDIDRLKPINDTLGHQIGDTAIVETADVLKVCFRGSDILGRLGGDEFALLLPGTAENTEESIRGRLQREVQLRNEQPDRRYPLSISVGIVAANAQTEPSMGELLAQADARMYEEKQKRRSS